MEPMTWGFIGTITGALVSIATTIITSWSKSKLALSTKRIEREELAKDFQRTTLIDLQNQLLEWLCSRKLLLHCI